MALSTRFFFAPLLLLSVLVLASASAEYGYKNLPKPTALGKPKPYGMDKLFDKLFGVQGFVYCKHGSKSIPIKGAYVRVTCLGEDSHGYETAPFSVMSGATDAKGYFFASLCPSELEKKMMKLKDCKAFLESSPMEACDVPTDMNYGVSGCPLTSFRLLENKKMKLFSLKPFYYKPEHESTKPVPVPVPSKGY